MHEFHYCKEHFLFDISTTSGTPPNSRLSNVGQQVQRPRRVRLSPAAAQAWTAQRAEKERRDYDRHVRKLVSEQPGCQVSRWLTEPSISKHFSRKIHLLGSYDVFRYMCTSVWVCECDHIPGLRGRLPGAIVAGAGGVMLVGGLATRSPDQVLPNFFVPLISYLKTYHLSILK